jgi:hypothetical protein
MKNKLLLCSALVSAVALTSGVNAETKVGGNLEQIWKSVSRDKATEQHKGANNFGSETNISISSSKELDNGLKASFGFTTEDGSTDAHYLTIGTDQVAVTVGRDRGDSIDSDVLPYISDDIATVSNFVTSNGAGFTNGKTAHDADHIDIKANLGVAAVTVRYAPSNTVGTTSYSAGSDDGGVNAADLGGSSTEIVVKGNFGVEGLSVLAGQSKNKEDTATGEDNKMTKYGATYNFGQFSIGAQRGVVDDGAGTNTKKTNTSYGASFAANDNLSVGLYIGKSDKEGSSNDEESKMIQIGYNLGGIGLEFGHMKLENFGHSASDDADITFIRTIQKF